MPENKAQNSETETAKPSECSDLLYCVICKFDKNKFEEHRKDMRGFAYFNTPEWDRYKPVVFKDMITNEWVIECQNCGAHIMLHEKEKYETIKQWNEIERAI